MWWKSHGSFSENVKKNPECFQIDGCPPSVADLFSPTSLHPRSEGRHERTSRQTTANTPTQPLQMRRIIRSFLVVRFSFNCVGVIVFVRTTHIHLFRTPFSKEKQRHLFILSNYCFLYIEKKDVNGFICTYFLVIAAVSVMTQTKCDRLFLDHVLCYNFKLE